MSRFEFKGIIYSAVVPHEDIYSSLQEPAQSTSKYAEQSGIKHYEHRITAASWEPATLGLQK